ncbi:MAG TPA: hypothetical protein V6C63_10425, partial [Allocoleopsis sp.]
VLQKPSTRLPWVMSGEATQQRRVLERVRSYLVSLQQKMVADEQFSQARTKSNLSTYDIQYQPTQASDYTRVPIAPIAHSQDEATRQIMQAVAQEMEHLRTSLTQPLQADLEALRQQRESLVQEIRQLETQRQHYSLAQQQANQQKIISEFLQVLMGRLQDSLAQQVAQTLSTLQTQAPYELNPSQPMALGGPGAANQPLLNPGQRLEQLQMLQARSDQLLMNLDSTLGVVFEALQRNVQSYQESLSGGLERMHDLGQQGEVMFTALVSHLAQQLGREASSFLHSSLPTPELTSGEPNSTAPAQLTSTFVTTEVNASTPTPTTEVSPASSVAPPAKPQPGSQSSTPRMPLDLPYAGAELRQESDRPLLPDLDPDLASDPDAEFNTVDSLEDLNLEGLDLADVNLDDELDTLLDVDLSSSDAEPTASADLLLDDLSSPSTPSTQNQPVAFSNAATSASELEFLEQLDIALHQEEEPSPAATATEMGSESQDWGASVPAPTAETSEVSPEPTVDTDDLYASLFGAEDFTGSPTSSVPRVTTAEQGDLAIAGLAADLNDPDVTNALSEPIAAAEAQPSQSRTESSAEASELFEELADLTPETRTEPLFSTEPTFPESASVEAELDETVTTLEDFLFADAADLVEPTAETTPEPVEVQSPAFVTPEVPVAPEVTDLGDSTALNFEGFQSSFTDETDQADPLMELAELLGDAEVVETEPAAIATPDLPSVSTQPNVEASATENERLLSELSLQDIPNLSTNNAANTLEDAYVPAAPEESLIATHDDLGDATEASLWLDDSIVQQLNEDLFTLEDSNSFANPSTPLASESRPWDNLTLEDFAETLPETLPPVEPETSEDLSDDLSTFWEEAELPSVLPEAPSSLTLDAFDLLEDSPATSVPADTQAVPSTAQPTRQQPTELDTQDLTLDDAFVDFLEATGQPEVDSSDRNLAPPDPSNLQSDEKKKLQ